MDGILVINKATGMTSHDVVARVRRVLKQRRVGHAGTLDPAASGVLPVCLGQATRVAEYLSDSGKAYRAEITFGVVTDTGDAEGTVIRTADSSKLNREHIEAELQHFLGPQLQVPPRFSAIKLQGQPAYKLARAGTEVSLQARPIEIERLYIIDWHAPRLTLDIACSKGTYIRSLAYDLGERLGCGAHLSALVRTRSGPFTLADSITLEQLEEAFTHHTIGNYVFPPDSALQHYPALHLDEQTAERVLHGNAFRTPDNIQVPLQPGKHLARIYNASGQFIAIASRESQQQLWRPIKVFNLCS
ncbi:MAG: tRNA pseudouridine(55) synthase TruB [Ktedonobacteraceae bacterium]|nr:tRNA pseudouridine(55) synthase TruB [Ktedonobacteraceae bacterium]